MSLRIGSFAPIEVSAGSPWHLNVGIRWCRNIPPEELLSWGPLEEKSITRTTGQKTFRIKPRSCQATEDLVTNQNEYETKFFRGQVQILRPGYGFGEIWWNCELNAMTFAKKVGLKSASKSEYKANRCCFWTSKAQPFSTFKSPYPPHWRATFKWQLRDATDVIS